MKRVESTFQPLEDNQYTMYATEAKFIISKNKQTPGINVRLKVNDVDETGAPQKNAGRTIFNTFWMTDKTIGMYCGWLDALGFKTNDDGDYLLSDGSLMPDPTNTDGEGTMMEHDTILPFLVGAPFIARTKHSTNEYAKEDGSTGSNDQYRLSYLYKDKKPVLSIFPRKVEAFAVPQAPAPGAPTSGTPNF